jgi:hypothetical protein
MGVDYYNCAICNDIFADAGHYGHCGNCESTLCGDCYDKMQEKNGVLGEDHEKANMYGPDAPKCCSLCDGSTPEMVTITKAEYESLLDDKHRLECLEAHGVDNWQGYDDAMEMYREDE